jgi:hypothetical protein
MPDIDVTVNIDVWCAKCGAGLCGQTKTISGAFHVYPCEACLEKAESEGYDRGWDTAKEQYE